MSGTPNDPTRSGGPVPAPGSGSIRLSRGEVEALCLKAARGAGMSWGMAEEAGHAAGFLSACGQEAVGLVLGLVDLWASDARPDPCPELVGGVWTSAKTRPLCPISLGAVLSDHATLPGGVIAGPLKIGPVAFPGLLLSALGSVGARHRVCFGVAWDGCRATVGQAGLVCDGDVAVAEVRRLAIVPGGAFVPALTTTLRPCGNEVIRRLDAYAMRTTVPASAASRAGAGADKPDD